MSIAATRRQPRPIAPDLRRRMEAAVERLLAALDAMGGDPDAEPSLGAPQADPPWDRSQADWTAGADDDRELDVDSTEADDLDRGEAGDGGMG